MLLSRLVPYNDKLNRNTNGYTHISSGSGSRFDSTWPNNYYLTKRYTIFYKCYNLGKKPNNKYLLYAWSRKVGCLDRREMEKRGEGKAEIHVLSASWIYPFRRRTQTTHNQPNIIFTVCEIADGEFGILKIHIQYVYKSHGDLYDYILCKRRKAAGTCMTRKTYLEMEYR
jgi:hypothetical protein